MVHSIIFCVLLAFYSCIPGDNQANAANLGLKSIDSLNSTLNDALRILENITDYPKVKGIQVCAELIGIYDNINYYIMERSVKHNKPQIVSKCLQRIQDEVDGKNQEIERDIVKRCEAMSTIYILNRSKLQKRHAEYLLELESIYRNLVGHSTDWRFERDNLQDGIQKLYYDCSEMNDLIKPLQKTFEKELYTIVQEFKIFTGEQENSIDQCIQTF